MKLYYKNNTISYNDIESRLGIKALEYLSFTKDDEPYLLLEEDTLSINSGSMCLKADFLDLKPRMKKSVLSSELLVKAAKIKDFDHIPKAIDATAGFGTDSFLLACYGYDVLMFENNKIIYELLNNAMIRGMKDLELSKVLSKMKLVNSDSIIEMPKLTLEYDLVYLDPMFKEKTKSSLVKKKFQLLHLVESPCNNESELFSSAINSNAKKIIVKRPIKGDYLDNKKPSYDISGKAIRYDVYINIK